MQEIRCPKCGEVFQVDESGYAAIVKQVRDKEFEKENGLLGCKELALYKLGKITEQEFKEAISHYAKDYKTRIENNLKN